MIDEINSGNRRIPLESKASEYGTIPVKACESCATLETVPPPVAILVERRTV
jgi:hypothetical protein